MTSATPLFLYDDATARGFEPFALTRPVSELRAGTEIIRRRWEMALGLRAAGTIAAAHLADFTEAGSPPAARDAIPAGAVIANSRFAPALTPGARASTGNVWMSGGRVAAVRIESALPVESLAGGGLGLDRIRPATGSMTEIKGSWLDEVWHLITLLLPMLRDDIDAVGPTLDRVPPEHATVIGAHGVHVERGAVVEPHVVIDVSAGPVMLLAGATVRAFTRLVGPCFVGTAAHVLGDRVHGCSIGEHSVIRGEISETIVLGHSNKGHEGFVGHSVLGRWVNLGAGTITSNLKNTYGSVPLWTPQGVRDSGALKLGAFFGDHVKTGIGARFTTGSVVGAGSNVYGAAMPPRYVPPFSWGEGNALGEYRVEEFLRTAERAMARRGMPLSEAMKRQLRAAHALGRANAGA